MMILCRRLLVEEEARISATCNSWEAKLEQTGIAEEIQVWHRSYMETSPSKMEERRKPLFGLTD